MIPLIDDPINPSATKNVLNMLINAINEIDAAQDEGDTPEAIKTKYESNPDTNAFTDAEQAKLAGLDGGGGSIALEIGAQNTDQLPQGSFNKYTKGNAITSDTINEIVSLSQADYDALGVGWNLAIQTVGDDIVNIRDQQILPRDVKTSVDGTKMYMTGTNPDTIFEYDLSVPYSPKTAVYNGNSFSVASEMGAPNGMYFRRDGLKFFVLDQGGTLYSYSMSTAWDITSASYDSLSLSTGLTTSGVAFNPDGSQLFVTGFAVVTTYDLSTDWDISTGVVGTSFNASAQETEIQDIAMRDGGNSMVIIGINTDALYQYDLGTSWDVSTAILKGSSDLSTNNDAPVGLQVHVTGEAILVIYSGGKQVIKFDVATDGEYWDLTGLDTTVNSRYLGGDEFNQTGMYIDNAGATMYTIGTQGDSIDQYTLSTPWDVTSAGTATTFSVAAQDGTPTDVWVGNAGTKLYVLGNSTNRVHQYTMSVAYDISTATYDSVSFNISGQEVSAQALDFKPDGLEMYVAGNSSDSVNRYTLGVAFDVSSAVFTSAHNVSAEDNQPYGLRFKPDGLQMYMLGLTNRTIYEYTLGVAWDPTSESLTSSIPVGFIENRPEGLALKTDDGEAIFFNGTRARGVHQLLTEPVDPATLYVIAS